MNKKQTKILQNFYKKHTKLCDKLSGGYDFGAFLLFYRISLKNLNPTQKRMLLTNTTYHNKPSTRLHILLVLRNDLKAKYFEKVALQEDFHAKHGY